jgi:hypothetical protein
MSLIEMAAELGGLESFIAFAGLVLMVLLVDRFFLKLAMDDE